MITLDIGLIAAILGLLGTVVALFRWIIQINRRFERLERHDRLDYEARELTLGGLYAALDGLHQLGANGDVTSAQGQLKQFMFKR